MTILSIVSQPSRLFVRGGFLARFLKQPSTGFGVIGVAAFIIVALAAPWIAPYSPTASNWSAIRQPPSMAHWLGTDDLGRDILWEHKKAGGAVGHGLVWPPCLVVAHLVFTV